MKLLIKAIIMIAIFVISWHILMHMRLWWLSKDQFETLMMMFVVGGSIEIFTSWLKS